MNKEQFRNSILTDYTTACISRQLSTAGRKEVHAGKAKFGIFGDGKEIAQLALAKVYQPGDWRSGYYRDQTLILAAGLMTPVDFLPSFTGIPTRLKTHIPQAGRLTTTLQP